MAPPRAGSTFAALVAVTATLLAFAAPHVVVAQPGRGAFEDATVPQKGEVRLRIAARFDGAYDQFGRGDGTSGSDRVPLGTRFSTDTLGASRIPTISSTALALRDSVGVSGLGLSLGTVETQVRTLYSRIPLQLEVGLTRRISLSALVPLVRSRSAVTVGVNRGGTSGNLGFNPANPDATDASTTAAATRNALVQAQFGNAIDTLAARLTRCPTSAATGTPTECLPIIANRATAQQLVTQTRTVARGVAQVYGNGTTASAGTLFVPVQGSDAQLAVQQRLQALATQFVALGVAGTTFNSPTAATARLATPGFQRVLTEPAFGILADTVRTRERAAVGDVELGGNVMLLDTFAADGAVRPAGTHVRSTLGAAYRLATGSVSFPTIAFDVPSGDGSAALLLRSATDVSFGRRLWATVAARAELPTRRDVLVRVPLVAGELFSTAEREVTVARTLGSRFAFEATPRWTPNDAFGVSAHYSVRVKRADQYDVGSDDAQLLEAGTAGTAHLVGLGLSYSTLSAYSAGHSWLPVDVSYIHTSTFAASGGVVPATRSDEVAVRIYFQLLGRGTRRPATSASAPTR